MIEVRAPTWDDFDEVLALLRAAEVAVVGDSDWTADELATEWRRVDLEHDAWILELDGRIAAYATLEDRGGGRLIADGYVLPALRGRGVGSKVIEVTEEHARTSLADQPQGERVYLQNATLVGDACMPNLYARHGYTASSYQYRMLAELAAPPEVPAPAGIEIRLFRDPSDRRSVYSVLEDAFATGPRHRRREYDEWAPNVFGREKHDPSLLWVATEAGEIVGACVCGWKEHGDWGWIGTLGVLPSHRGRGIGDALLRTAFAEFWRRGERRVALGVRAEDPVATGLYERAGMRILYTVVLYEKELRAAAS